MKKVKGGVENKMVPITLMLDPLRHQQLRAAAASTRSSMSEFVRVALDNAMAMLKDPVHPDKDGFYLFFNYAREETADPPKN